MRPSLLTALLFTLLASPVALTGCQTETQVERESDGDVDIDREYELDTRALEATVDSAGQALEDAAEDAADVIDENVDLGDDAENQDG